MTPATDFVGLFAQEAAGRLDHLDALLLELETAESASEELLADLFREAHTLKGAAAVVGLIHIGEVAHSLEDLLDEIRGGRRVVDPEIIDALLAGVDGLRALVVDAITGVAHEERAGQIRTALVAASVATRQAPKPLAEALAGTTPGKPAAAAPAAPAAPAAAGPHGQLAAAQRETVLVPAARLDDLVRLVGEASGAAMRLGGALTATGVDTDRLVELRDLRRALAAVQDRTMRTRMVPVGTVTEGLRRAVRDLTRRLGKNVRFECTGEETEIDRGVLQQLGEALLHLVRNALDHGIETPAERIAAGKPATAAVRLDARQLGAEVVFCVSDDGRGIDIDRVRAAAGAKDLDDEEALALVFRSGLSTASEVTDVSGRGVGLDAVGESLRRVRGRVEVISSPGEGTEFQLHVPITLAVLPCLVVTVAGQRLALPMHTVVTVLEETVGDLVVDGRPSVRLRDGVVPLTPLALALGLPYVEPAYGPAVVLSGLTRRHALRVDSLHGQRDVVVQALSPVLPTLPAFAGASAEARGDVLLVLDAGGVIDRARRLRDPETVAAVPPPRLAAKRRPTAASPSPPRRPSILVVDDAVTVRELQRSILERAGYAVETAGDGAAALASLASGVPDLVLTDVGMPRVDGLELVQAIRSQTALTGLPVVLLTSRGSEEDRRRGMEAGADAYIVKSAFDEAALLALVHRLLGRVP